MSEARCHPSTIWLRIHSPPRLGGFHGGGTRRSSIPCPVGSAGEARSTRLPPNFNKFHRKFRVILFSHFCRHAGVSLPFVTTCWPASSGYLWGETDVGHPLIQRSFADVPPFPLSLHNQQRKPPLIALWPAFRDQALRRSRRNFSFACVRLCSSTGYVLSFVWFPGGFLGNFCRGRGEFPRFWINFSVKYTNIWKVTQVHFPKKSS